jgi:hypothetical protein
VVQIQRQQRRREHLGNLIINRRTEQQRMISRGQDRNETNQ